MLKVIKPLLAQRELYFLLVIAILIRGFLLLVFHPQAVPDTGSYVRLAHSIDHWSLGSTGDRTPPYPVLILLCRFNFIAIYIAQSFLGVATSLLLYGVFTLISGSPRVGLVGGLAYGLNPTSLLFESTIATEALTAFLVVCAVFFVTLILRLPKLRLWLCFVAGLTSSLAGLTRPSFALLPVLLLVLVALLFYMCGNISADSRSFLSIAAWLLPFVLLIGGWGTVNYARFHWFTLSTQDGYTLLYEAIPYLDKAPSEWQPFVRVYHVGQRKYHTDAPTFLILNQLERVTGQSQISLSKKLETFSLWMFAHHPVDYAKTVTKATALFLLPHLAFPHSARSDLFHHRAPAWVYAYTVLYVAWVSAALYLLLLFILDGRMRNSVPVADFVIFFAVFGYTWASTSFTEWGDNDRFKFPVEALLLGWGFYLYWRVRSRRKRAAAERASSQPEPSALVQA